MLDHRMETFLTVCETMNFTQAAAKLHITQPAVSQHIRYLEGAYDVPLFHYKERKLMLTPEGALLYKAGLAMRNDDRELRQRLYHARAASQPIHFGVTKTIGEYVVAPPLSRFIRRHPDAAMTMKIANTEELIRGLEEGDIQFALVEGYFDPEEFEALRYDTVAFVPVTSARHEFQKTPKKLEDLFTERLILREPGSGTRRLLENQLALMGQQISDFSKRIEIGGMHAILQLLEEDMGVSFLYESAAEGPIREGRLMRIDLADFSVTHDFTFIWEKESLFGDTYREWCREMMEE
ncbi:LysR family transcriptional regulator [Acidaminococcus sp.]|uniref:LysR family transcriptional regulator n=1 Tax=Acidaminococcus sp. TaxID=1872103 RepID=UPI003AB12437